MKQDTYNSKNPTKDIMIWILILLGLAFVNTFLVRYNLISELGLPYEANISEFAKQFSFPDYKLFFAGAYILVSLLLVIFDDFDTKQNLIKRLDKKKNNLLLTPSLFSISALFLFLIEGSNIYSIGILTCSLLTIFITRDFVFNIATLYPKHKDSILRFFQAHISLSKNSDDGYDSVKDREKLLNQPFIGKNKSDIQLKFHHKFHNNIELLTNGNPRRGNLVVGGAGAGKSYSILNPMLIQTIKDLNIPMVLYDFKFPNKDNQTKIALKAFMEMKKEDPTNPMEFHLTTFSRKFLHNISRVNPVCRETMLTDFHADSYMKTFFSSMDKKWLREPDFWAKSTFAYAGAVALAFNKYLPNYSLAHIIHFLTQDYELQVNALIGLNDDQINAKIENVRKPIMEKRGGDQLSGIFSSLQNFLSNMHNPEFFYAISKSEATLHVNDPNRPMFLSIGNDNLFKPIFSPLISMYSAIIFSLCNREQQLPLHFMADEAPTLFLPGLDDFINTGRGNNMITTLGVQGFAQNIYMYGQELAKVLQGSLGSIFCGQLNDDGAQEAMSKMMGNYKMRNVNNSRTIGGNNNRGVTQSENTSPEAYIRYDEIANLDQGYFFGKVSEGEHTKFMGKVDVTEYIQLMESANDLPYPIGPGVQHLADIGDVDKDLIMKYYKNDSSAEARLNEAVYRFAESEYKRIMSETMLFIRKYSA